MALRRLFIANRGEIAVRVIRAARSLGIETVAGVSEADRHSMAARLADRAVVIGPPQAARSSATKRGVQNCVIVSDGRIADIAFGSVAKPN